MNSIIFHTNTAEQVNAFVIIPGHGLLLHGPAGAGKSATARYLIASMLKRPLESLDTYPYLLSIDAPEISAKATEVVSQISHFLSLKVPGDAAVSRFVLVHDAHALSLTAQNSLLKLLEEPPASTLLILTAHSPTSVLPTISSRLQQISVKRPPLAQVTAFFERAGYDTVSVNRATSISGGLPGLTAGLLSGNAHPLLPAVEMARELLQNPIYERLILVDKLSKDRQLASDVLFILQQMAHARLLSTVGSQFNRWLKILTAASEASAKLAANCQPKLTLDALMLKLN